MRLDREILSVTGGEFDKTVLMENSSGRIRLLHEKDSATGAPRYVETTAPTDATMLQRLYDLESSPRANRGDRNGRGLEWRSRSAGWRCC